MGKDLNVCILTGCEGDERTWESLTEKERLDLARALNERAAKALEMKLKECQPAAACSRDSSV